ncbi:Uncharacterised protein [uncultured archaeon]|nr:Uncharacterised protein [uncultured archaeon]
MGEEIQNQEHRVECNGKGGMWCFSCKTAPRLLRFMCSPFRAIYIIPWATWKDVLIIMSGITLVMGITIYTAYLSNLSPSRDLPEVLKYLLSGIVGYVFAYVPASKAISAVDQDRSAVLSSDVGLQQVIMLLQQQKEIYESKIERLTQYIEEMEREDDSNGNGQDNTGIPKS